MTTGGWIIMIVSVSAVSTLFFTCLYKVLTGGKEKAAHMHGLDIDTKDVDTE
ncbi:MAG: hypothetical protein ACI9VS_004401 [Candidatus Binatia bacterium]|jgi:hypothetical protein